FLTATKSITSKLHIGIDGWSSPNTISFLGVMLHFHHKGAMHHLILDFLPMTKSHTGVELTKEIAKCL
ncbi:hypothetical protein BOTBODRAFT_90260, partial [Botryobasidium botryosum FD-172 SS1]